MVFLFLLGRILFGGFFLYNAYNHFKNVDGLTAYSKMKGVPFPRAAVIGTGILLALGGLSMVLGFRMVIGMWLLLAFLVPTTFIMHRYWKEKDVNAKMAERIQFSKNIALIGSLLMMISMAYLYFS